MSRTAPATSSRLRRLLALLLAVTSLTTGVVLVAAPSASAATGAVTAVASGRCLDVTGASRTPGTRTIIWDCHGNPNQQWSVDATGRLRTLDTLCLVPAGGQGSEAVTATCSSDAAQRWRAGTGRTLVNVSSGLCLDVYGARTAAGTPVIVWPCSGAANQQFTVPAAVADTGTPTPPSGLRASGLTCTRVTLTWAASSDDVGVTAYDLFHDGQLVRSVSGSTLSSTVDVTPGVSWAWYVNSRDAAGNVSQASGQVTVTPPRCEVDTVAPSVPTGVTATAAGTAVTVRWSPSTDAVGVTAYDVRRDGVKVTTVSGAGGAGPATTWTDSGLAASRSYTWTVVARDGAGNASAASAGATATTAAACSSALCSVQQVATDTDIPWGLVTLPSGEVLYSRRDAHSIVALDPATGAKRSVGTLPGVASTDGEGGLMGLAIASTFGSDRWLYVMHTTPTDNRVVRVRYTTAGVLDTSSVQVLLSGILRNKFHNGGRLRFGPDGMLYVATGDAQNGDYAQALTGTGALNGKILRITPTGDIPSDNPFGSAVWSYGHRNPQGLAFDAAGRLWQQEFGNATMDETNLVVRGGNYGWPQCEGTASQSGAGCGAAGLVAPKVTYPTADGSCSGLTVVKGAVWVACGRGSRLYRHTISGTSLTGTQQLLVGTYGRLRTVEPAADGGLWLTTTNQGDKDSIADNSAEKVLHLTIGG